VADAILRLDHLRKAYGALVVTDDVSLDIRPGELHAIIGPNGAGKTTLIHQISGLAPSDSGRILFDGADVTGLSLAQRVHRGLARSFQITSILPGFSALENVALAVQARSGSSFRLFGDASRERGLNEEAMTYLAQVGLGHRAMIPSGQLSHGETLRGLKGRYTIVLIEHDMDAVFSLADRVSVLVYGRVIATGRPDEVRANAEVRAAYLGEEAA
jgi:branched-chain amino acid transport system ATP-binding protein